MNVIAPQYLLRSMPVPSTDTITVEGALPEVDDIFSQLLFDWARQTSAPVSVLVIVT